MRPGPATWIYNLRDCTGTARIDGQLDNELVAEGLRDFYVNHVHPLFIALYNMQQRGIVCDPTRRQALSEEYADKIGSLETSLKDLVGGEITEPGSRDEWRNYLYGKLGLKPKALTTVKRQPTLKKINLYQHIVYDDLPPQTSLLLRLLIKWFEYRHIKSSFIDNVYVHHDGRVRATWMGTGSRTGRPTSRDPDLQNIPKGDRGHNIRRMYRAALGQYLVNCDAGRMEMLFIALASGAGVLTQALLKGLDLHSYNYYLAVGKTQPPQKPSDIEDTLARLGRAPDPERQPAKHFWYAWEFGAADDKIMMTALEKSQGEIVMSPGSVREFRAAIEGAYPEIPKWWEQVRAEARKTMNVPNEWGRPRILFSGDTHGVPPNTRIQGTGADWVNGVFIRLDRDTQRAGAVVHHGWDSLMDETSNWHESAERLAKEFSRPISVFGHTVSMPYELETGEYWGEMEKVKV